VTVTGRRSARGLALASTTALLCVPLVAGCTDNAPATAAADDAASSGAVTVQATDTGCRVSTASAPSGKLTFSITNVGTKVNEFYLLGADGLRILGEVENIGPGLSRDLVLSAAPGSYFTACKPGMVGDGIRAPFAVSDSGVELTNGDDRALAATAAKNYQAYVKDQTDQLVTRTDQFVAAYLAGDDAKARALYPRARVHWERIEPVAESFGDLDPKLDLREADLEPGQRWTGWHRLEKDLWPARAKSYTPLTAAERKTYAADLVKNTATLDTLVTSTTLTTDKIANGSRGLLDEVAKTKVTGEEEYWSRTDLHDFQANVDGARVAFEGLRPLLGKSDPQLGTQIDARFTALQKLLDQHRSGNGFVSYDDLGKADVKALSNAVNALAEPLSKLTAAVV
jgi:iron uptake system component EfeO